MVDSKTNSGIEQLLRYAAKLTDSDGAKIDGIVFDYLLNEITRQIPVEDPVKNFFTFPALQNDRRYKGVVAATAVLKVLPEDEIFGEEEEEVRMQIDDLATILYDEYAQKGSVIISKITDRKDRGDSAVYFQEYMKTRQTMASIQELVLSVEVKTMLGREEQVHNRTLYKRLCDSLTQTEEGIQRVNRRDETGYKTIILHFSTAKILYTLCKEFLDQSIFHFEQRFEATERDLEKLGTKTVVQHIERQLTVYGALLFQAKAVLDNPDIDYALETTDKYCDELLSAFEGYIGKHEYAVFCEGYARINKEQQFHKEMFFDSDVTVPKIESRLGLDNIERRLIPTPDYVGGKRTTDKPVLYISNSK